MSLIARAKINVLQELLFLATLCKMKALKGQISAGYDNL